METVDLLHEPKELVWQSRYGMIAIARRRMKWRKISEQEVEAVLAKPDKLETAERGRIIALKRIGDRFIKVSYKDLGEELLIISAVDKSD